MRGSWHLLPELAAAIQDPQRVGHFTRKRPSQGPARWIPVTAWRGVVMTASNSRTREGPGRGREWTRCHHGKEKGGQGKVRPPHSKRSHSKESPTASRPVPGQG